MFFLRLEQGNWETVTYYRLEMFIKQNINEEIMYRFSSLSDGLLVGGEQNKYSINNIIKCFVQKYFFLLKQRNY